jgi:3-hydroxymyristoyl/3-hydroxydecanoyl-(acyl carrier protein) dehydratase
MKAICESFRVAEDSARFIGHFPERPILPGVAQLLDFVVPRVERLSGGTIVGLSRVKFLAEVLPGDQLRLELTPGNQRVEFRLLREGETVLTGKVLVA